MKVFFFSICILFLAAAPAFAQSPVQTPVPDSADIQPEARYNITAAPRYNQLINQALARPTAFDFSELRLLYTMTPQYDPAADKTQRRLLQLSAQIKNTKDQKILDRTLSAYSNLVFAHLANIDVVAMAEALAEEDKSLGDPEFFKWVYNGLLQSVSVSADGSSVQRAYDVLALGEENALFRSLGLRVLASRGAHEGAIYYNMHETENIKTGERREIFTDVTKPMKYLEWEKGRRNSPVNIPRR